jgi:hypothetical protein
MVASRSRRGARRGLFTVLPNGLQLASSALPTNNWDDYMIGFAGALLLA